MTANSGILFDYPITNPLSAGPTPAVGTILSGCSLVFYQTLTTTATPIYADGALATSLGNIVNSNASGQFVPLYMNPSIVYRVQLWSGNNGTGTKLQDIDPYVVPGLPNQALLGAILYPQTAAEIAAGVIPVNFWYPPGYPDRFGTNTTPGITDMTLAVQAAINSCDTYTGLPGSIYGVTTVTFPPLGPHLVNFNGSTIRGIATTNQSCVVAIKSSGNQSTLGGTTFLDYRVDSLGPVTTPNPNYTCGTWWYNNAGGSQFNKVFGMQHQYLTRGLVYGALPGTSPSGGLQSENSIYGMQNKGVENPLYCNAQAGFLHLADPILYSGHEGWTATPNFITARAIEIVSCAIFIQGGEIQIAASNTGFAADLQSCVILGTNIETANPLQIIGDGVKIIGCSCAVDVASIPAFMVKSGVTGTLTLDGSRFSRPATLGSFDGTPLVNANSAGILTFTAAILAAATSATLAAPWGQSTGVYNVTFSDLEVRPCTLTLGATTCTWTAGLANNVTANATLPFTTLMMNTQSFEWAWKLVGGAARLVSGGAVSYRNHRLSITAADPNVYQINSPGDSLLDGLGFGFDPKGYDPATWVFNLVSGGGSTLTNTTNTGPPGYLASQLTLHATGNFATARLTNSTSLATIKTSAFRVEPNEFYWISCWMKISAGADARLGCEFWNLAAGALSSVYAADGTGIGNGVWTFVEGPLQVPATAAYMSPSVYANTADVQFTDIRIRRAN